MSVQILHDSKRDLATFYCSTTDVSFGPVFSDSDDHDAEERAEAFLRWTESTPEWPTFQRDIALSARRDVRQLTELGMEQAYSAWLKQEADQWKAEDAEVWAE